MDNSFFIYLERLELLLFFSGYPLVYLLIHSIAGTKRAKRIFKKDITNLFPYAYALVGILYLGFVLKNFYPDYSLSHIKASTTIPLLKIWGLLAILFFIPFFAKKPFYSLFHSLVFFFFVCRDLYFYIFTTPDKSVLKNDMNLYTYSLLINLAAFLVVFFFSAAIRKNRIK